MEESKIRNEIITISGEPVSGKGTVLKEIARKLKEQGLEPHLITTGNMFRNYYNLVIDFAIALRSNNQQRIEELSKVEDLKEVLGSEENRKKVMKLVSAPIDLSSFRIEDANNNPIYFEVTDMLDAIVDHKSKKLGLEINSQKRPTEIWIIDSRLAFSNIPDAFAVRLTTNKEVAGKRLFNDKDRGREDKYDTIERAIETREERRRAEIRRYQEKYGIDITDENNFDLIMDTSYASISDTADVILGAAGKYYSDQPFAKKWASPKIFLPLQRERDTLGQGSYSTSIQDTIDSIKRSGYYLDSAIEVLDVDGAKYIYEGHHRNFAMAYLGRTLIPYDVIAKDDETIYNSQNTARQRANSLNTNFLYGHEGIIEQGSKEPFSYRDVYPELVDKLIKKEANPDKDDPDEDEMPI